MIQQITSGGTGDSAPVSLLVLAPYVRIGIQGDVLYLGFGSIQRQVCDRGLWEALAGTAAFARQSRTEQQLREHLARFNLNRQQTEEVWSLLAPLLVDATDIDNSSRYARHLSYYRLSEAHPARVQDALAAAHVVIVGVGGIGSLVAVNLATAGVGHLTLVDDDHVELSNLTRQLLYTESSVGQPKVTVASQQLSARNHTVHIDALAQPVVDPKILPPADLWLVSADTRGLIPVINRHAVTTGTPWLHACYVNDIAAYGPLVVPGMSGCWDCADLTATHPAPTPELASAIRTVGAGFHAPSFGPINMLVSALASLDAIRFLGGVGTPESWNRRIGVHTAPELRLEYQLCPRDIGCVSCGDDQHD